MSLRPNGACPKGMAMGHIKCLETGTSDTFDTFAELIAPITAQQSALRDAKRKKETDG
jgi:hypothetical protein